MDTGSSLNLLGTAHAEILGIDWRNAPEVTLHGICGEVTAHVAEVRIVLPHARSFSWTAHVAFSSTMDRQPLLGHQGFFEHFEARFKTAQRRFRVFLK